MLINPASRMGKWLHWLFEASLILKGLFAAAETLGGLGLLLTPNMTIIGFVGWLTTYNLAQQPDADMAKWAQHLTQVFPIQVQHFYAFYLLAHGAIKLAMVGMLARRILWAYPGAMVLLAGFVVYQLSEFLTHDSWTFLALSFFDSVMIALVYREWSVLKLVKVHPIENRAH
jgi:uncharacterized membrane protein